MRIGRLPGQNKSSVNESKAAFLWEGKEEMNNAKLQSAISAFVKNIKANAAYYDDNWTERKERKDCLQ